jgi:hypothetical protein
MKAVSQYRERILGFYPKEWLEDTANIALVDEKGNVALFEHNYPGVYTGHYFFSVRGKEALSLSKEILRIVFTDYNVKAIRGITPLKHLGARWMTKQLGFKSYGIVHTPNGPEELFVLTKEEWEGTD